MSVTTYSNNPSSTSFTRRNIRSSSTTASSPSNAITNEHPRLPLQTNHLHLPIPPIGDSLRVKPNRIRHSVSSQSPTTPRYHFNTDESISVKSSKQIYTFSNPPRELQRIRHFSNQNLGRQRVASAPEENSPRSRLTQPKVLSANDSSMLRSYSNQYHIKPDEQQQWSLNALIKEQNKSKVPKAVQKRRIRFLFHCPPSKQEQVPFVLDNNQISPRSSSSQEHPILPLILTPRSTEDFVDNNEPEMADSMQLAAILAEIQLEKDWNPNETSKQQQQPQLVLDSSKYEYDVSNPADGTTFRLSPRTLKPDEELAARKRFAQYYQHEMRSSANAKIPSLLASIVTENNATIGNSLDIGPTFTFKFNSSDPMKKTTSNNDNEDSLGSTTDSELVQLCYDATLKLFCDPETGLYYDLSST
ncbi:unnamed protein product [Adineta ricciae]|uniref:Uncharacterized protein n=1 Tax=Adineta ricciae TaxID=249248 RepID=A0A816FAF2_ADIRI|nr:unnamed protein product [Adineta ricciae]